jgi:putative membrane protein
VIFLGVGLATLLVALSPWVDERVDASLTAHMLQHVVLTMVAAPLLVLGGHRVLRWLPQGAARALVRMGHPVGGFAAFAVITLATHLTGFYDYALEREWAHVTEHVLYVASAVWFWWPVLGRRWRWAVPYLLAAMPLQAVVGVVLLSADATRYAHYNSLADQHRGGALMWLLGSLAMAAALVWCAWDWLRAEERRALAREAYGR